MIYLSVLNAITEELWSKRTLRATAQWKDQPAISLIQQTLLGQPVLCGPWRDEIPSNINITHGKFELNIFDKLNFSIWQEIQDLELEEKNKNNHSNWKVERFAGLASAINQLNNNNNKGNVPD